LANISRPAAPRVLVIVSRPLVPSRVPWLLSLARWSWFPPPPGALEVSLALAPRGLVVASRAVAPSTDWPWFLVLVLSSRPQPRRPRGFLGLGSRGSWPPAPRGALEDSCGIGSLCVGHRPSPLAPSRVPWPWFLPCWSWFPAHWRHRGFLGPLSWVLLACRSWCPLFGSRRVGFWVGWCDCMFVDKHDVDLFTRAAIRNASLALSWL
jgi:hypothetical protein